MQQQISLNSSDVWKKSMLFHYLYACKPAKTVFAGVFILRNGGVICG